MTFFHVEHKRKKDICFGKFVLLCLKKTPRQCSNLPRKSTSTTGIKNIITS